MPAEMAFSGRRGDYPSPAAAASGADLDFSPTSTSASPSGRPIFPSDQIGVNMGANMGINMDIGLERHMKFRPGGGRLFPAENHNQSIRSPVSASTGPEISPSFAGRPSALAAPFVPSATRRVSNNVGGPGHNRIGGGERSSSVQQPMPSSGRLNRHPPYGRRTAGTTSHRILGEAYASGELRSHAREEATLLARTSAQVPDFVGTYGALFPMEGGVARSLLPDTHAGSLTGTSTGAAIHLQVYKALHGGDGEPAALLRVVGMPPASSSQIVRAAESWRRIRHSGIASLKEVFSSTAFNPRINEIFIAYNFPGRARPFHAVFLANNAANRAPAPLPEDALWALATQLIAQVAEIHKHGLSVRGALDASAVLVIGRNRCRLFGVGLNDMFDPLGADHVPSRNSMAMNMNSASAGNGTQGTHGINGRTKFLQKQDLANLGNLLLLLALRSNIGAVRGSNLLLGQAHSLDVLRRATPYSQMFMKTVELLVDGGTAGSEKTIIDVVQHASPRILTELGNVWGHSDNLTNLLFDEFENSRMLRLISLICFVTERNGDDTHQGGGAWSETGDRYVVKLFRDYLFHRDDETSGAAILDMANVIECLHRLDVGSQDQILLAARDNKSLIVASYEEVRRCLITSIDQLIRNGHTHNGIPRNNASIDRSNVSRGLRRF